MRWRRASGVALAGGALVLLLTSTGVAARWDLPARDLVLSALPAHTSSAVAAVIVDERSLAEIGRWPWPRSILAALVERISAAEPRAIAVDILLIEPAGGDEPLRHAFARSPVILAAALDDSGRWVVPPRALAAEATLAHATFEPDHDGVVRRISSSKQSGELSLPALALAAARRVDPAIPLPVGRTIVPSFRVRPSTVETFAAHDVLAGRASLDRLRNRIVFVGVTALGLRDQAVTPVSGRGRRDAAVLVHAAIAGDLLGRATLAQPPRLIVAAIASLLILAVVATGRLGGRLRAAIAVALVASPVACGVALLITGWETPFVSVAGVLLVFTAATEIRSALVTARRTQSLESALGGAEAAGGTLAANERRIERLTAAAMSLRRRQQDETDLRRVVVHELRTPLTSVRGLTQLLSDYQLSEGELHRVATLINDETGRLQSMVDALLEIERVGVRERAREATIVDFRTTVQSRVDTLRHGANRSIVIERADDASVLGDAGLLERAIDNLIGNALKFSPAGSPVFVRVVAADGVATLEVEDRGPGVAEEDRERIFRRFGRGRGVRGVDGLGLGLALVAEIAAWHSGTIAVHAASPHGSVFRMRIPLASSPD